MAHLNKVVTSINAPGESRCVDVLQHPDGSFGFFPVGYFGDEVFETAGAALAEARVRIPWLLEVSPG